MMRRNARAAARTLLRESALRTVVRLLLESRALQDEAVRLNAREAKEGRQRPKGAEQWSDAAKALEGVGAAKELLGWLSRNVPQSEPLADVLPLLRDWARARDENKLLPAEKDLSRLTRTGLEAFDKRMSIGRSMEVRMPARGPLFTHEPPKPARDFDAGGWDVDELLTVRSGGTTWDVYFPEDPGESCAVARMASPGNDSYEIPWCTARDKNNMFYGYAANDVMLYYVVNREEPEEKYSLGFLNGELIPPRDGDATVDWQNRRFDPRKAFGSAWTRIHNEAQEHALDATSGGGHPVTKRVFEAALDPAAWRELIRRTSDDTGHRLMLYRPLVMTGQRDMKPMHPEVAIGFLGAAAAAGSEETYLLNELRVPVDRIIDAYGASYFGSPAQKEVEKAFRSDIDHPGGYHTVSTHIVKRMREFKLGLDVLPAAVGSIRGVGTEPRALGQWLLDHAAVLPLAEQDHPKDWGRKLVAAMTDEQLAIMFWPFKHAGQEVEKEFFERKRKAHTSRWDFEFWATALRDRVLRLDGSEAPVRRLKELMGVHGSMAEFISSHFAKNAPSDGLTPEEMGRWHKIMVLWRTGKPLGSFKEGRLRGSRSRLGG